MHCGFLDLEGAKMSKSLGNVVRLRDALERVDPEALRYFFLSTHYRNPLSFSDKSLADAEARMEYFYETLRKVDAKIPPGTEFVQGPFLGEPGRYLAEFQAAMDDDFNCAGALAPLSGLFAQLNELVEKPPSKDKMLVGRTVLELRELVRRISKVLGLFEDQPSSWLTRRRDRAVRQRGLDLSKIEQLIIERNQARAAKDWKQSDRARDELKGLGVEIMDGPEGTSWKVAP